MSSYAVGVDVGGTKIAAGLVSPDGELTCDVTVSCPRDDPHAIVAAMVQVIRDVRARADVDVTCVGAGIAGFVDAERRHMLGASTIPWAGEPVADMVAEAVGVPTFIDNDANAAAWGEYRFGAGQGQPNLVVITVGTGLGGGLIVDGRVVRGNAGVGAEVGHVKVERHGRPCGCGQRGCWESYASGTALVEQTRAAAATAPDAAALIARAGGRVDAIAGPMITELALAGDDFCRGQLEELGRWIGEGLAQLGPILDPGLVLIGGGVCAAGEVLLEPVRRSFDALLSARDVRPEIPVRIAALGNTAGLIGAADLARATAAGSRAAGE